MNALLWAVLVFSQDDATIAEWVRQLGDDAVDVREQAAANLARAGRAAEKRLREALRSPNEEVRGRAAQLLAGFETAERLKEFDAGPSRVTVRRERAPLREVLEEIRKQTRTRLEFAEAPVEDKVSLDVKDEPLFRALDALCRSHGKLAFAVENRRGDNVIVTVSVGTPSKRPHFFHDQYLFVLEYVHTTTTYDLEGGAASRMRVGFRWSWEKGTRPLGAAFRLREIVDGAGTSYPLDVPNALGLAFELMRTGPSVSATIDLPLAPPEGVDRLSLVKGDLELTFPEGVMAVTFDGPEKKAGTEIRNGGGSVRLVTIGREEGKVRARILVEPAELASRLEMKAVDKGGKEVAGRRAPGVTGVENEPFGIEFTMPAEAELAALRFSAPTGSREKKVPVEFRDLRIR